MEAPSWIDRPRTWLAARPWGRVMGAVPWEIVVAGGALAWGGVRVVGALRSGPYLEPGRGGTTYVDAPWLLPLFVPYALALLARPASALRRVGPLVAVVVGLHVALAVVPPSGSQDLFQYLQYGQMQAFHGANPYVVAPGSIETPAAAFITWRDQTSVYGPAWTLATTGTVWLSGARVDLLPAFASVKALALGLDLAVLWSLLAIGRGDGTGRFAVTAWGLNPLVLLAVPVEAHADVAVAAAFVGAVLARRRGRSRVATALLALGALVKAYAVVGLALHLALVLRERGPRTAAAHAAGSAGLAAALFAPYWQGLDTFGGAAEVAGRFGGTSLSGAAFRLLSGAGPGPSPEPGPLGAAILVAGAAFVAGVLLVQAARVRDQPALWHGVALAFAAYLLASPWSFHWHALPLIALACALPGDRAAPASLTASGTLLIAFRLPAYRLGLAIQALARYGVPFAAYAGAGRVSPGSSPAVTTAGGTGAS
ncbi:MAG: DUF2029 domain-containing protein [Actinobacteria bacterium]|nr:DUF2029 domain-containing protein [Actinomycetota bacterium]